LSKKRLVFTLLGTAVGLGVAVPALAASADWPASPPEPATTQPVTSEADPTQPAPTPAQSPLEPTILPTPLSADPTILPTPLSVDPTILPTPLG
jgi:hypothetical protein